MLWSKSNMFLGNGSLWRVGDCLAYFVSGGLILELYCSELTWVGALVGFCTDLSWSFGGFLLFVISAPCTSLGWTDRVQYKGYSICPTKRSTTPITPYNNPQYPMYNNQNYNYPPAPTNLLSQFSPASLNSNEQFLVWDGQQGNTMCRCCWVMVVRYNQLQITMTKTNMTLK